MLLAILAGRAKMKRVGTSQRLANSYGDPCRTRTKSFLCSFGQTQQTHKTSVIKQSFEFMVGTYVEIVSRTASSYLMERGNLRS